MVCVCVCVRACVCACMCVWVGVLFTSFINLFEMVQDVGYEV